jgi:hypothetical protein
MAQSTYPFAIRGRRLEHYQVDRLEELSAKVAESLLWCLIELRPGKRA